MPASIRARHCAGYCVIPGFPPPVFYAVSCVMAAFPGIPLAQDTSYHRPIPPGLGLDHTLRGGPGPWRTFPRFSPHLPSSPLEDAEGGTACGQGRLAACPSFRLAPGVFFLRPHAALQAFSSPARRIGPAFPTPRPPMPNTPPRRTRTKVPRRKNGKSALLYLK